MVESANTGRIRTLQPVAGFRASALIRALEVKVKL